MTDDRTAVNPEPIPDELKERDQWLLWDSSHDTPRQPHWAGNFAISWSDPADWHSFEDALELAESRDSWGIGYVMALTNDDHPRGLYGCLDLDGCLDDDGQPKDWVPDLSRFGRDGAYAERSPSGDGLHIPLVGQQPPEWWTDCHFSDDEHEGVEYLTHKFCTFTGDAIQIGKNDCEGVADTNPAPFLHKAYRTITGEYPQHDTEGTADTGDRDWTEDDVEELLDHVDSGCGYSKWRNLAFAVHDWDDSHTGKSLFEQWSRGSGWDDDSQRLIDAIWSNSEQGSGVTFGTLVYHAKQNGWSSSRATATAATDGGGTAAESPDDTDTGPDGAPDWDGVRAQYAGAQDADEKNHARYNASEVLLDNHQFVNVRESDELYKYDPGKGIYRNRAEMEVREITRDALGGFFRRSEVNELLEHIRACTTEPYDELGGPEAHIPAENGVLNIDAGRYLEDHSPDYRFLHRLPVEYDPEADCPEWRAFLDDSLRSETERKKLQEFVGYSLHHWGLPFHKSLFIVGPKASGKSTFLDTVRELVGENGVANLSPQQMSERFGGAELFGKWANIRSDIPSEVIENTGEFKEIIAGDPIKAERKHQDPFFFKPTCKHFYSANTLPDTEDDDDAFFRRILLVAFPSSVPREERDADLGDKLLDELPGILNWALDGLDRLLDQGAFTGDRVSGATADTWKKWGHTPDRFASVCVDVTPDGDPLPKKDVYRRYVRFCEAENMPAEPQQTFTRRLKTEFGVQDSKAYVDGRQQRCFVNIQFTDRAGQYVEETADVTDTSSTSSLDSY